MGVGNGGEWPVIGDHTPAATGRSADFDAYVEVPHFAGRRFRGTKAGEDDRLASFKMTADVDSGA